MSKKFLPTDDYYKKLICESNKLGNALLANLVSEKIIQKKRKITKINFSSEIVNYKNEVDKIRSLKVGFIHNILKERSLNELDLHFDVAEKLLSKIEQFLSDHVKHDATGIISKEEFEALVNNKANIEAISVELKDIPDITAENLKAIQELQVHLNRILDIIDKTTKFINDSHKDVLFNSTSKIIDCLR